MRLGLMVGYSGAQIAIDIKMIQEAEKLGYDSVWTAEAYGSDAVSPLAWIAAQTTKIKLGTGIMQCPGRSPANTAMTAMTIDALSGGLSRVPAEIGDRVTAALVAIADGESIEDSTRRVLDVLGLAPLLTRPREAVR